MPDTTRQSTLSVARGTWSQPRYASRRMRWWWMFFIPFMFISSGWPLLVLFVFEVRNHVWWLLFLPEVILVIAMIAMFRYRARIQRDLRREPLCPGCGYAIHDLDACPECGVALSPEERKNAWRDAGYNVPS